MLKIRLILLLVMSVLAGTAQAAWYVASPSVVEHKKLIKDTVNKFEVEGLKCGVTETSFLRDSQDRLYEMRDIYCWMKDGTYVFVTGSCNLPQWEYFALGIAINGKRVAPALICGPREEPAQK